MQLVRLIVKISCYTRQQDSMSSLTVRAYPPKERMRYAHELLNGEQIWENSSGEPTNHYLSAMGFEIREKLILIGKIKIENIGFMPLAPMRINGTSFSTKELWV